MVWSIYLEQPLQFKTSSLETLNIYLQLYKEAKKP